MTKIEYSKCEKLMEEAIRNAQTAREEFETADKYKLSINFNKTMINLYNAKATQHLAYAEGINQVLATLGFRHDGMKELSKLL